MYMYQLYGNETVIKKVGTILLMLIVAEEFDFFRRQLISPDFI